MIGVLLCRPLIPCVCVCVWKVAAANSVAGFDDGSRCCLVMERRKKRLPIIRVFELHAQFDG